MKLVYPAIFESFDNDEGFTVTFPDLPGCVTEGKSLADAIFMAEDAASGWILTELEEGKNIPKATKPQNISLEKGQFINIIPLDMDSYAEKYGNRAVKKTLTIPAWQNTFVEKNNMSCSKILQEAIGKLAVS